MAELYLGGGVTMKRLLLSLVENCEIGIIKDTNGLRILAKGPLALVALIVIVVIVYVR